VLKFSHTTQAIQYLSNLTGKRILVAGIAESWDKYLLKEINKKTTDTSLIAKLKDMFLEFEKEYPKDAMRVISKFIKDKLDPQRPIEKIKAALEDVFLERLPAKEREKRKLENTYKVLKEKLKDKDEEDLIALAKDIVENNKNVNEEIKKLKHTESISSKELIGSEGIYKLYEINEWKTDGTLEKHLDTEEPSPVHIDLKGTKVCTRFEDYFDNSTYRGEFYLITKNNKPYILISENNNEIKYTDNNKNIQLKNEDKNVIKLLISKNLISLENAIRIKDKEVIKMALDAGAKLDEYSLNNALEIKDKEIIKMILDAGAKPNKYSLNNALEIKDKEIIKMILDAGAKPNENSLNYAIYTKDKEIIKWVLDAGAKPIENSLYLAIKTKDKEIVKMVLDAGAKPNKYSLDNAIYTKDKEIIKWVLDAGAKPNENSLNNAVKTKDKEIIKLVLDAGAKPNKYSLEYAIRIGDKEIIDMVKAAMGKQESTKTSSILRIANIANELFLRTVTATEEEDQEYYKAILDYYGGDEDLLEYIKSGEGRAQSHFMSDIKTERSDNGNILIRYIQDDANKIVAVLGLVSKTGKILRADLSNMKSWMNRLLEKLEDGYQLFTSANQFSKPLINRVFKMAEKKGLNIQQKTVGSFEYKGTNWDNIIAVVE